VGLPVLKVIRCSLLTVAEIVCCTNRGQDADSVISDMTTMALDLSEYLIADIIPFLAIFADSHKEMSSY
jgi:hypothetical protein